MRVGVAQQVTRLPAPAGFVGLKRYLKEVRRDGIRLEGQFPCQPRDMPDGHLHGVGSCSPSPEGNSQPRLIVVGSRRRLARISIGISATTSGTRTTALAAVVAEPSAAPHRQSQRHRG